jgi:hypothetical protein
MENKIENITLPVNLIDAILNYMASKPFGEVHAYISEIQRHASQQQPQSTSLPKA